MVIFHPAGPLERAGIGTESVTLQLASQIRRHTGDQFVPLICGSVLYLGIVSAGLGNMLCISANVSTSFQHYQLKGCMHDLYLWQAALMR